MYVLLFDSWLTLYWTVVIYYLLFNYTLKSLFRESRRFRCVSPFYSLHALFVTARKLCNYLRFPIRVYGSPLKVRQPDCL